MSTVANGEIEFLGDIREGSTGAALVLDLVVLRAHFIARALERELRLISLATSARTADLFRLDLADLDDGGAEAALHRLADLAGLQREGGIGDRGVEHPSLTDETEIDVAALAVGGRGHLLEGHIGLRQLFARQRAHPLRFGTPSAAPRAAPA